jgi:dehydratase
MRSPARPIALVFLALAAVLAVAPPAAAATVPVTLDCQAQPPIGSPQQFTLSTSIDGVAPATVASGGAFQVTLATDPITVPGEAGGYRVDRLRDLDLRVPVPQGSTFQSATLTGGSNLGPGVPDVFQSEGIVTVRIPGPIPGGATFQPPALHLTLTASGDPGTTINTRLAGTGYADPGLTFTATVQIGFLTLDVPAACFPNPSPTLTSTTIEALPSS